MKKLHKLAAATAMALSLGGLSPYASAIGFVPNGMEISPEMRGDTLLFPVFYGRGENLYTITNNSGSWIQGHLRFRGAAWSGELLDMDIILSPGDVFVFRVADIDGDGHWELDQSLDPKNFRYTGMLSSCVPGPYLPSETGVATAVGKQNCMDPKFTLVPLPRGDNGVSNSGITTDRIDYHVHNGYIEFIGEGVLDGMSSSSMEKLINPSNAGKLAADGQREVGDGLGTSLWAWVVSNSPNDDNTASVVFGRAASDVSNALGGTAFVTLVPGQSQGVAYNAESIVNFRTNTHRHRVDNYVAGDQGVILHTDDAFAAPGNFTYVYGYQEAGAQWNNAALSPTNFQEGRISFNNTWGPTLADGDDYRMGDAETTVLSMLRPVGDGTVPSDNALDEWDLRLGGRNSIAEVEEAIRLAGIRNGNALSSHVPYTDPGINPIGGAAPQWGRPWDPNGLIPTSSGQSFTGFYFDNSTFDKACDGNGTTPATTCSGSRAQTWYFVYAPTKFFYAEDASYWVIPSRGIDDKDIRANMLGRLTGKRGYLQGAVEHVLAMPKQFSVELWDIFENTTSGCVTSPCVSDPYWKVHEELSVFSIANVKNKLIEEGASSAIMAWDMGRLLLEVSALDNTPTATAVGDFSDERKFPVIIYSFDITSNAGIAHWRPMHR